MSGRGLASDGRAASPAAGRLALPGELRSAAPAAREIPAAEPGPGGLLAIDTSLGTSVALGVGGRIFEAASDDPLHHAEAIGGLLAGLFRASGASARDVSAIAYGVGPGPFTGLRVGIAAAHAFAAGRGARLLPLQGHEAVALAVLDGTAAPGVRVVQDARRRELFVTDYAGLDWAGVPVRRAASRLVARADLEAGPADAWPERVPAARLVQLAARRLAAGHPFEADRAVYLRAPDVRRPAPPKRVSGA